MYQRPRMESADPTAKHRSKVENERDAVVAWLRAIHAGGPCLCSQERDQLCRRCGALHDAIAIEDGEHLW